MADELKLAIPADVMATTCADDSTATCALVSVLISAVVVTAISAADKAFISVRDLLEIPVIAVPMRNPMHPETFQIVSLDRHQQVRL